MTTDGNTFLNNDGFVEFPFTTDPSADPALRLQFRNHIVALNEKYLKANSIERWCPEDFERLFSEFKALYVTRGLSGVERKHTDWTERPDFGEWLDKVHTFDPSFKKFKPKETKQNRHHQPIYKLFKCPDKNFAAKHNLYYSKRAKYPWTEFCPFSTPIGRRIVDPDQPEAAAFKALFEPDTTHIFTRPVPFQWTPSDCNPTKEFVNGEWVIIQSPKIPSNEEIRITHIEEDRKARIWDAEREEFYLPEFYIPSIPVCTCFEGAFPPARSSRPPTFKKQTALRYGTELTAPKSSADLDFIGWIVDNFLLHEIIPAVGDDVEPLRSERVISLPRKHIIHDQSIPTDDKFRWTFFGRGLAYFPNFTIVY